MNFRLTSSLVLIASLHLSFSQNVLFIPDTLDGPVYNMTAQTGTMNFITGYTTPTYGYNGNFLGPTLLINKGENITLNVTNNLTAATTVHWHGFHVAAIYDGGPHQIINPGDTWSPSFKMLNNAGTFWYHPHGENKTELQVTRGLAGMIIVRDPTEATYNLPRTYGIDDFPLIVQTKAFDMLYQLAIGTHEDSVLMVNGTIDPFLEVPQQIVRFRLLNGSADRTYNFGLSDNSTFYLIASDGGILSSPVSMTRLSLSPGERAEILVDFSSYSIAQQIYLMSYASELQHGIIGADSVGTSTLVMGEGYYSNSLNGLDFNVVRFDVAAQTSNPVLTIPATFNPVIPFDTTIVAAHRTLNFNADTTLAGDIAYVDGPFYINDEFFHMDSINIITYLNDTEIWTLTNSTMVAHPFHIHDIQFLIADINGVAPPPEYAGFKDVILVMPNDTIRFVTKFTTFANPMVPYMYHCHLLHHEDEGMMGSFLVLDTTGLTVSENKIENKISVYPNPTNGNLVTVVLHDAENGFAKIKLVDVSGRLVFSTTDQFSSGNLVLDIGDISEGVYILQIEFGQEFFETKIIR